MIRLLVNTKGELSKFCEFRFYWLISLANAVVGRRPVVEIILLVAPVIILHAVETTRLDAIVITLRAGTVLLPRVVAETTPILVLDRVRMIVAVKKRNEDGDR